MTSYEQPRALASTDEWPHDRTYPQFEDGNLTRGWRSELVPQKDGDGDEDELSDFEAKLKAVGERQKLEAQRKQGEKHASLSKNSPAPKPSILQQTARDPLTSKAPPTLKARNAASALARPSKPLATTLPNFAAPTAVTKARAPAPVTSKKSLRHWAKEESSRDQ